MKIKHEKIQPRKIQHKHYNTHVKKDIELSPKELLMTEKELNQQTVDIRTIPFQNDDPINDQLKNNVKK